MIHILKQLPYRSALALTIVAALAAGCGGNVTPTSPNTPDFGNASFGTQGTSAIWGQLVGGGGGAFSSAAFDAAPVASGMGGVQVSVQGTGVTTTTNGAGQFLLNGVPNGSIVLQFSGGGTNATLTLNGVGNLQLIQITVQVDSTTATVVKQNIEDLQEFDGEIADIDAALSSFTLADGTTVLTGDATWWDSGGDIGSYAALMTAFAAGVALHAEGRLYTTPEGALLATVVKVESAAASLDVAAFTLSFDPDKWSLGWVDNGNEGQGNSAIEARIANGPFASILPSSIEMEGPDGTVTPFDWEIEPGQRFEAKFTKSQVISVATSTPAGESVEITVRGTLFDGTPFELTASVQITDDDDDDTSDDDDNGSLDAAVAAQAIADIQVAIDYIDGLVDASEMTANNAKALVTKLESAIGSLAKLNGTPAVNKLEAFLNDLDQSLKTGKIDEDDADYLEQLIEDVIDLIEGGD
ncbi:MAG: hypothetical protein PVJ49_05820 [Acidobacteriota bacterium]|jgi:hypothetical protein